MRRRRDNSIDNIAPELRDDVRRMLSGREGRFGYRQIVDAIREKSGGEVVLSISALQRYYRSVMAEEIATAERRAQFSVSLAEAVTKAASAATAEDREAVVLNVIDGALLTLETDPSMADPAKLFDARAKNIRADVERGKLALARERHHGELAKLRAELADAKNEIKALRAGARAEVDGPTPASVFLAAGRRVIDILQSYAELRPLLQKFDSNIARRLAVESERFDAGSASLAPHVSPLTAEAAHG